MHFIVDTVSDFTFFENALLGIVDSLDKCVGITRTFVKKLCPLTYSEISLWEHKQGVMLPEDLRTFYSSSNGFLFEWDYAVDDEKDPEEKITGKVHVNSLEEVTQVYGYETTNDSGVRYTNDRYVIRLAPESKIFELSLLPERGKVVLIYLYPKYVPTIWLVTTTMTFYFLANDIATYLRMALTHLGIPNWQFAYTPQGVPPWTENLFRILTPHLLPLNTVLEKKITGQSQGNDDDYPEVPLNKFDSNLFKFLPRTSIPSSSPRTSTPEFEGTKLSKRKLTGRGSDATRLRYKYQRKPLYYIKKR